MRALAHAGRRRRAGWPPRRVIFLWAAAALVVWNGLYDVGISRGIREYLLQAALHDAGRGPAVSMSTAMHETVRSAVLLATFWTALMLSAAAGSLWLLRRDHAGGTGSET